jgi:hypothetical protein
MASTIIHSLQEFHIHYGMCIVTRRLGILLLFFSLFKREIIKGYSNRYFSHFRSYVLGYTFD